MITAGGVDVNSIAEDLPLIEVHSAGNDNNIHPLTKVVFFGRRSFIVFIKRDVTCWTEVLNKHAKIYCGLNSFRFIIV